jgi:hypothetical protein
MSSPVVRSSDVLNKLIRESRPAAAAVTSSRSFEERFGAFEARSAALAACPTEAKAGFHFHLNEKSSSSSTSPSESIRKKLFIYEDAYDDEDRDDDEEEGGSAAEVPITSVRGTVRGVKNRVRAGIATFQQGPKPQVSYNPFIA